MDNMGHAENNRDNPFYEEPLHKAFYYPSPPLPLSEAHASVKKVGQFDPIVGHPDIEKHGAGSRKEGKEGSVRMAEFMKMTNTYSGKLQLPTETGAARDNSSQFDESWPVSERPSTASVPGVTPSPESIQAGSAGFSTRLQELEAIKSRLSFDHFFTTDQKKKSSGAADDGTSKLSKYVDRFRHGAPMSREERQKKQATNASDFWWIGTVPSDSSTPKSEHDRTADAANLHGAESASLYWKSKAAQKPVQKKVRGREVLAAGGPDDRTKELQERADVLLERSESTLNSSEPVVSTVGLGSTATSSTIEEHTYRPRFTQRKERDAAVSFRADDWKPGGVSGLHGESDILQQWRMRRKMDMALERVLTQAQSDRPALTTHKDKEIESKLTEFRRRLCEGGTVAQSDKIGSLLNNLQTSNTAGKTATDLQASLEKSTGKSEESELENSTHLRSLGTVGTLESVQIVSAASKDAEIQTEIPEALAARREKKGIIISPIASPSLPKRHVQQTSDIGPHLHLACDIIPCPHAGNHDSYSHHHHGDAHRDDLKHQSESCQSNIMDHGPRLSHEKHKEQKNDIDVALSADFEVYKREHLRALQREIEESLASSDSMSERNYVHKSKSDQKKKKENASHVSGMTDEIPERDLNDRKQTGAASMRVDLSRKPVRAGHSSDEEVNYKRDSSHRNSNREHTQRHDPAQPRKPVGREMSKFSEFSRKSGGEKRSKTRDKENMTMKGQRSSTRTSGDRVLSDVHSSVESMDGIAASPKSAKLTSTIGQVVTEHLFVASSVECDAGEGEETHEHKAQLPDPGPAAADGDYTSQLDQDIDALAVSDGEDYVSDPVLQDLRRRRSQYIRRLQQIENQLQQNTARPS